jgi:hypothetical protein
VSFNDTNSRLPGTLGSCCTLGAFQSVLGVTVLGCKMSSQKKRSGIFPPEFCGSRKRVRMVQRGRITIRGSSRPSFFKKIILFFHPIGVVLFPSSHCNYNNLVINDQSKQWILRNFYTHVLHNIQTKTCVLIVLSILMGCQCNQRWYLISVLCSWHTTKSHICPNHHIFMKWLILGRMATKKYKYIQ